MKILYVDESGTINREGKPFIICGILMTPEQSKTLEKALDNKIASLRYNQPLEIHASEIYNRRDAWRHVPMNKQERIQFMKEVYEIIDENSEGFCFAYSKETNSEEALLSQYKAFWGEFEKFHAQNNIIQIIMDKGKFTAKLQLNFKSNSGNILDRPIEIDSRFSRGIQAADMVAFLINQKAYGIVNAINMNLIKSTPYLIST